MQPRAGKELLGPAEGMGVPWSSESQKLCLFCMKAGQEELGVAVAEALLSSKEAR